MDIEHLATVRSLYLSVPLRPTQPAYPSMVGAVSSGDGLGH